LLPALGTLRVVVRTRRGIVGIAIISFLLIISIYALLFIPATMYSDWNNPNYWIDYPKAAAPSWVNLVSGSHLFPHMILGDMESDITTEEISGIRKVTHTYFVDIQADSFPDDFMFIYSVRYGQTQPVIQIQVVRPDNETFNLYYSGLPSAEGNDNEYSNTIFSSDKLIKQNLLDHRHLFNYNVDISSPETMVFSEFGEPKVLKGMYQMSEIFYFFDESSNVQSTGIILGGKVFGLMGTDDLRRDLALGMVLGAPVALFIGLTVSTIAVSLGLIYGVISGYKGGRADESLMRVNDVFYALPALPLLIILSITFGRSIFLIAGFLIIFGWVGTAKIIRSLALQIKTFQYVEAAKIMGQSDMRIVFKHIIPQLLPLTFASMAIAVPAAILGEAALSFLGLGDPAIPTWGQMLHEANNANAAARGIWWWIAPPGLMIAITGLAFYLLGNSLDSESSSLKNLVTKVR
jgi:peptide/nickel transport system permease protein